MEAFLEDEDDRAAHAARGGPRLHARPLDHARAVRLRLQEQGRPAAARRDHRLPAVAARRARRSRALDPQHRARGRRAGPTSTSPSRRSPSRSCPTRTSASSPTSASTRAVLKAGSHVTQRDHGAEGARRPHPPDARQPSRGARRDRPRRDRGRRRPQADDDRRHAERRGSPGAARVHRVPRAGHRRGRRAQDEGRPGQAGDGPRPPRRGGPDLPGAHRRGDRPDRHLRHGRAAPRDHRRPPDPRVRRAGAPSASRRSPTARRCAGRSRRCEGKFVRQTGGRGQYGARRHLPRAERAAATGTSSSTRSSAASFPREYISVGRPGHPGGDGVRRPRRLPRRRHQGRAHLRLVPRRRLLGDGVQDRRLDGVQERDAEGRARSCSSPCSRSRW